jgi:aldose 1-epimerase
MIMRGILVMAWKKEIFGTLPNGGTADVFTLTNEAGATAVVTSLGATWLKMIVPDKNGKKADVLLGNGSVEQILTHAGHLGEVVGRNANRIGGASVTIAGKTYELEANSGKHNNLHSGPDFYAYRIWDAIAEDTEEGSRVTFFLLSPDGDQGYPGNAKITMSYTLTPDNALKLEYHMVSDKDTIANFTNHAYFNLAGHNSGDVLKQKVWLDADYFTIADEESIPTGELVAVKGTPMDFTTMKEIGRDIEADYEPLHLAGGYDHNWALNHKEGELALSAKMEDPESGRVMEVYTDLPGIQFYTGNYLKGQTCKEGAVYTKRCGCCFETQYFPDCVHKENFAGPYLAAGESYHTVTIYHFIAK